MKTLFLFFLLLISFTGFSQLFVTNGPSAVLTNYGTGQIDDSVYYFCTDPVLADLEVIPEDGVAGWTFDWQIFNDTTFSWDPLISESNVPVSNLNGVGEGGYRVTVTDGNGDIVGCYRLWIVKVITPAIGSSLDVTATPVGCDVQLDAIFTPGTPAVTTPYYTPPPEPLYVDSTTEINVSFSANHTYVSDLGFYLIGPASCGSPVITLSPVNYQIGLPMNCNSGNNVDSLSFSSLSTSIFNICATAAPLSGTYGVQGNGVPIDWTPAYGCDATDPGWKVQIFDCVGLDVGFLTEANVSFDGLSVCGDTVNQSYASGPIMEPIFDNACNNFAAATYTVPIANTAPVVCTPVYEWNADPYYFIADSMGGPSIVVSPAPSVPTYFTYDLVQACDDPGGACGTPGTWNNGVWFYPPSANMNISGPGQLCIGDPAELLFTDSPGGDWSGNGIIDPISGLFDPFAAGVGFHTITYILNSGCIPLIETLDIEVVSQAIPNLSGQSQACELESPIQFTSDIPGGTWSGNGIIDPLNGMFDPGVAGVGIHVLTFTPSSSCAAATTINIEVVQTITPVINVPSTLCVDANPQDFSPSIPGGDWIGSGFLPSGMYDPNLAGVGVHQVGYFVPGGCSDTAWATVEVVVPTPIDVNGFESICLNGDSLVLPDPANGIWTGAGIVTGTNIFVAANAGIGIHQLTYTVNTNCTTPGSYTVEVNPLPPSDFTSNITESCAPGQFILTPNNQNILWNYQWNIDGNMGNEMIDTFNMSTPGSYSASLTVTDGNGCSSTTDKVDFLTVHPSPTAAFSTSNWSYYNTNIQFYNQSMGATIYTWIFDDLGYSSDENPSFQFPSYTAGDYEVCLIAENDFGCTDTTCSHIIIERGGGCYAPNSFSPNGDSQNETFLPIISGELEGTFLLSIFNRWGEQIFQTNDPSKGWDGTHEGALVQDGVYIWKINLVEESSELPAEYSGHVTLLK